MLKVRIHYREYLVSIWSLKDIIKAYAMIRRVRLSIASSSGLTPFNCDLFRA